MAVFYILFTALVMFNIEPNTFNNFFDAIYWSAISLTSVGYGDITPTSEVGRLFTMCSAFVGVAIIALPSGIITAGYLEVLNSDDNEDNEN
jgi:voltage-gated potassium channel